LRNQTVKWLSQQYFVIHMEENSVDSYVRHLTATNVTHTHGHKQMNAN